jgi:hypothetical protein
VGQVEDGEVSLPWTVANRSLDRTLAVFFRAKEQCVTLHAHDPPVLAVRHRGIVGENELNGICPIVLATFGTAPQVVSRPVKIMLLKHTVALTAKEESAFVNCGRDPIERQGEEEPLFAMVAAGLTYTGSELIKDHISALLTEAPSLLDLSHSRRPFSVGSTLVIFDKSEGIRSSPPRA